MKDADPYCPDIKRQQNYLNKKLIANYIYIFVFLIKIRN